MQSLMMDIKVENQPKELFKLSGILKRVLYFNSENSYCIAILENNQKICGQYFDTDIANIVGEEILLTGNWESHKKYGVQFAFEKLELKENELFFFLTKVVKGVTKSVANTMFKEFSEDELINILNNDPSKLLSFKGIKEKKLKVIVDSWNSYKHLREIGAFLAKYGVSNNLINKIYEHFCEVENLIEKIEKNPYMLIQIKGIGFKKADEIAINLGIDKKSSFRVYACMSYILKEYCDNDGHSSISKEQFFGLLNSALDFANENMLYEKSLLNMLNKKDIFQTSQDRYSPSMLYYAEKKVLEFFNKRALEFQNKKIVANLKEYIKNKEHTLGFKLNSEQYNAVETLNNGHNTLFLIGYAGTGKTTSSKAILELLQEVVGYDDIVSIALSGIAAQRVSDATGYKSMTIQSFLNSNNEKDTFSQKVILLDEASMVNSVTFYQIVSKIAYDTIFIVVGDDGQLPAIGAGNILYDCIKYNLAPICKLTKIYRQNENQAIALIANDIREGRVPQYKKEYEDFSFINISIENYYAQKNSQNSAEFSKLRVENSEKILNKILSIASAYIQNIAILIKDKNIASALTLFQVITPIKNGVLGVENLNMQLQKLFNHTKGEPKKTKLYEYRLGDKVIHIKNENMRSQTMKSYKEGEEEFGEIRVFNGQLGLIIKLDFENEECIVLYPNDDMVVFYSFDSLDNLLSLAYCLTIHKTQGMEYENAVIPMSFSHYNMHNTKLLYTAITRAKKMCYIVGEENAFISACKKVEITKRESVINDILSSKII